MKLNLSLKAKNLLGENKIKNKTKQILSKYEHGNNVNEHGKEQNE